MRRGRSGRRCALPGRLTVFFALVLTGCATAPTAPSERAPDWVQGASAVYPPARFLTGVGFGDVRAAAENRAYAAIARVFEIEVQQRAHDWESYLATDRGAAPRSEHRLEIDQATTVSTRRVLESVSIGAVWRDERESGNYALAVLDRRQSEAALRDRIAALDRDLAGLRVRAAAGDNKLLRVRALRQAIAAFLLRDAYNTQLRIVNPEGTGAASLQGLAELRQDLEAFLARDFRVGAEVSGRDAERVRAALLEGLTNAGLPVAQGGGADLVVRGSVELEPTAGPPQQRLVRWAARFDVVDTATGQVIGSVSRQGREGHLTEAEAEARALRRAQQDVVVEVSGKIAGFIYGEGSE